MQLHSVLIDINGLWGKVKVVDKKGKSDSDWKLQALRIVRIEERKPYLIFLNQSLAKGSSSFPFSY